MGFPTKMIILGCFGGTTIFGNTQVVATQGFLTSLKANMTMEHPPFEDAFPIENLGFSNVMLVFRGVCSSRFSGEIRSNLTCAYFSNGFGSTTN